MSAQPLLKHSQDYSYVRKCNSILQLGMAQLCITKIKLQTPKPSKQINSILKQFTKIHRNVPQSVQESRKNIEKVRFRHLSSFSSVSYTYTSVLKGNHTQTSHPLNPFNMPRNSWHAKQIKCQAWDDDGNLTRLSLHAGIWPTRLVGKWFFLSLKQIVQEYYLHKGFSPLAWLSKWQATDMVSWDGTTVHGVLQQSKLLQGQKTLLMQLVYGCCSP